MLCGLGSKFPATGSFFFVLEYLRKDLPEFVIEAGVGDYPIRQIVANKGAVYYDERPMSVYRYMTRGSFMKSIRDNMDKYVDYIVKMCVFYQRFSEYLDHKFDDIYSMKIDSDILGMAAATYDCREQVEPAWLQNKLDIFYRMLSGGQWIEDVKKLLDRDEAVWIYGTSTLAAIWNREIYRSRVL